MGPLLIVNPNTSPTITARLQALAQMQAGPHVQVHAVTARFGAPYIACEASYAVAAHATLDAWAAALASGPCAGAAHPGAVLIGCFGDPGLLALREASSVPVTGLAEAAFVEAARHGRFAIVTGGARWAPMLERLAAALGYADALAGIHTVAATGAQLAADPAAALIQLGEACRLAVARTGARCVILGGAGLAGMAQGLQRSVEVPLIDSLLAGTRYAIELAQTVARSAAPVPTGSDRFDVEWHHVSAELTARGRARE